MRINELYAAGAAPEDACFAVDANGATRRVGLAALQSAMAVQVGAKTITENGTYDPADDGLDAYSSVTVEVSGGGNVTESDTIPDVSDMSNGDVVIVYAQEFEGTVKPAVETPVAGIAGQNQSNAMAALIKTGTPDDSNTWTTRDNNYNDLWIGADYGSPIVLNAVTVAPRTWNYHRQIWTVIMEASNDTIAWVEIGTAASKGDEIQARKWFTCAFGNATAYRYYRLRTTLNPDTGKINQSATFTLYGLGFLYTQAGNRIFTKAYYKNNDTLYEFLRSTI